MEPTSQTICGKVTLALLEKADRLFRNDDEGTWVEVLQNARRAGATSIQVTIEAPKTGSDHCLVTVQDDGRGISDFQTLLTLGASDWSTATAAAEDPAGMGFYSLCRSEVEVHSGSSFVKLTPAVFLGKAEAKVEKSNEFVQGTRLRFTRQSFKTVLVAALERVTIFFPVEVRLEGQALRRLDFLEGSLHRELIDGIEVGFSTSFSSGWSAVNDGNWNFYGARIHHPFDTFPGLLIDPKDGPATVYARFNVLEVGRVKLQLPDRRAIIEDDFLKEFEQKVRAAAYRFFQTQAHHALPFRQWRQARQLGVALAESACLLTTWRAMPQDDLLEPIFGSPTRRLLTDVSNVLLVDRDLSDAHALDGALHSGATLPAELYREEPQYAGYSWYDSLPRIEGTTVLIDGVPSDDYKLPRGNSERPATIEVEITIEQADNNQRKLHLPAWIYVDSAEINNVSFVAVKQSPWDGEALARAFPVVAFLVAATFCSSDDCECDSWNTQMGAYTEDVEREVNEYFRGPRATLLSVLRNILSSDAQALAERLGVTEIKFTRSASDQLGWTIELINPPETHTSITDLSSQ